jgi:hypothetical protein
MGRDRPLECVPELYLFLSRISTDICLRPIRMDGEAMVDMYNAELERLSSEGKGTWFTAPWLYAE